MKKVTIHSTAIVDNGATIGEGTKVWHWSHVSSGSIIGSNCSLGQNVYIAKNVIIGNNVRIQNNVSVYENVLLEDDVFCGPSMVFTNVYNPRSKYPRKDQYKDTIIKRGVSMGANCTIICGNKISEYAFIGAGSVVTKNVKSYALMVGVPALQIGWMSSFGERIPLPIKGEDSWTCPTTGETYILSGANLRLKI